MKEIVKPLIQWFELNKRKLEWRNNPTAYEILISEVMLQQTRVEAVRSYYKRFIAELPNFKALANCSDEKLMKLWEGLGYYNRARNLKKCAIEVVNKYDSIFPNDYTNALNLPGIGDYTCGAILSRAYNKPYAAVDGNVLRVLSRYLCSKEDILKETTKKYFKNEIEKIIPNEAGLFNEALMELGATICMPKIVKCEECPLRNTCKAYQQDNPLHFPIKAIPKEKKILEYTCLFITDGNRYILKPKETNVLKGLLSPLLVDHFVTSNEAMDFVEDLGFVVKNALVLPEKKHIFTHQIWYMKSYLILVNSLNTFPGYTQEDLNHQLSIPTCFKKIMIEFLDLD